MVVELTPMHYIWCSDVKVAVRGDTIRIGARACVFWIQTTVNWTSVHRVNTSNRRSRLEFVRIDSKLDALDLVKVEHGSILVPDTGLGHSVPRDIWTAITVGGQISGLESVTCDRRPDQVNDRG